MEQNFYKMKCKNLFILLLAIPLSSCLKDDPVKDPFVSYAPVSTGDGWAISTPQAENMDEAQLKAAYKYVHESTDIWQIRSLLVFRNGKLLAESYTKDPDDIRNPRAIWSSTKQFMGILIGIAIDQGYISRIHDSIGKYLPSETKEHPEKSMITIDNLMSMRSGIAYQNDGSDGHTDKLLRQVPDNSLEFILDIPMEFTPGQDFHYHDGNPHIMSAIIQKQTGMPTRDWAKEVLFSKLNNTHYDWLNYKDGMTLGAFGIRTTPRELAKIGQCVLDSGMWNGQRIVSSAWINTMLQVTAEKIYNGKAFCRFWWRDLDRGLIFSLGHGGQYVFIKPSKDLVVVITAEPNTQGDFQLPMEDAFDIFDRVDMSAN
jgi:CubicO group peptidase (beta-lactamase class C family)